MTNCPFLKELWYDIAGKAYKPFEKKILPELNDLYKSEWSSEFENLMHNRMIMGAFRYGTLKENKDNNYDWINNAILRLKQYKETGNTELLVDVSNYMMVEYMIGKHPKKHFYFHDDQSIHLELK